MFWVMSPETELHDSLGLVQPAHLARPKPEMVPRMVEKRDCVLLRIC
jgi:hypothetical protein